MVIIKLIIIVWWEVFSFLSMLYKEKMHITLNPKQEAVAAITYTYVSKSFI